MSSRWITGWIFGLLIAMLLAGSVKILAVLVQQRADQGYVRDKDGKVWQLYRMQTFGIKGDYMAVYREK